MNSFIVFTVVIVMYLGLNEACKRNHVVIHNQLSPGRILDIDCRGDDGHRRSDKLNFNATPYIIDFKYNSWPDKTTWYCVLSHGPKQMYYYDLEVYHTKYLRCGQLRAWTAKINGIWFTKNYWEPAGHVLPWKVQ